MKLISTPEKESQIVLLDEKLAKLNPVTLALQAENITLSTAKNIFEAVISGFLIKNSRVSKTAAMVENQCFEAGLVKIQEWRISSRTKSDSIAV